LCILEYIIIIHFIIILQRKHKRLRLNFLRKKKFIKIVRLLIKLLVKEQAQDVITEYDKSKSPANDE